MASTTFRAPISASSSAATCAASTTTTTATAPPTVPFHTPNFWDTRTPGAAGDWVHRTRSLITVDTRQQTEWGTLAHLLLDRPYRRRRRRRGPGALRQPRLHPVRRLHLRPGLVVLRLLLVADRVLLLLGPEDTGDGGWRVAAYTANFGNGFSATVSLEDNRRTTMVNTAGAFSASPARSASAPRHRRSPRCSSPTPTRSSWARRWPPTGRSPASRTS